MTFAVPFSRSYENDDFLILYCLITIIYIFLGYLYESLFKMVFNIQNLASSVNSPASLQCL